MSDWDANALSRSAGGERPALSQPHLRLDGGNADENDVGLQLQRNGKPYKELIKIAHPPIIRRSDATATCHGEVRHELCRRVLLGFAASGVPGFRRSALLLLAALVKPKSTHQTGKQKI